MINGPSSAFPLNAARAYEVRARGAMAPAPPNGVRVGPVGAPTTVGRAADVAKISGATAPTAVAPASPNRPGAEASARIGRLVAGRVPGAVDFTGSAPTAGESDVLPMYTRAADKVEASVSVRIGSSLDLRA